MKTENSTNRVFSAGDENQQSQLVPVTGFASVSLPMHKNLQEIVNVQVDINRAVWAGNLTKVAPSGSCTTESNRDAYVEECLRSAFTTLKQILSSYQLDLDL